MNTAAVSPAQLHLLHHALGVTPDRRAPYRNHFVAGPGQHDQADLEALEAVGLMQRTRTPAFLEADDVVFCCTDAGRAYALDQLPAKPKRTRYQEYLAAEYSETFAEWLGIEKPRREVGDYYGPTAGKYRFSTSKATGDWKPTIKEAKTSYKEALAKARGKLSTRASA